MWKEIGEIIIILINNLISHNKTLEGVSKYMKKIISIISVALLLSAVVAPILAHADGSPQFNYMTADFKTLNVANKTTSTGWQDNSVSASAGDSLAFQVYYHNGVINSVAHNTRIRLNFPTSNQSAINVSVSLGADNAAAITDNVAVNVSSAQKLVVDTTSIKWYPNRSATPTIVPATTSGAGYVELNMGDIQGCWEYQGYVTFTASLITSVTPAISPQFNIFTPYVHTQTYNRDYYLLDVKNDTKGTVWGFPASADAGDTLTFYMYYHNGIVGSTATNTTLKVALPSASATSQSVTASLWSDNATNATAANPMTQSVPITLSSAQKLDYVVGSAKWYPNQTNWTTSSAVSFPGGQSSGQLFTSGINIGSINGCWEYSGAVVFQVKVGNVIPANPNLTIQKRVWNAGSGSSNYLNATFANSANAIPGDRLIWQLQIQNTGNTTLNNIIVRDTLPSYTSYISGSTLVDGSVVSNSLTSSNINVGSLTAGATRTIIFETYVGTSIPSSQTLTNYAYARSDEVAEKNSSAAVVVTVTPANPVLLIDKKMKNITNNDTSFADSVDAQPRQRIGVQITITNNGANLATASNVIIKDTLPSRLNYLPSTTTVGGVAVSDGIAGLSGLNIGSLASGQSKTIYFETEIGIESLFVRGTTNLTNTATVTANSVSALQDTAQLVITYTGCSAQQNMPGLR